VQEATLADVPVPVRWLDQWGAAVADMLGRKAIILGNEFLDALAPDQYVRTATGWAPRAVGLDTAERLEFTRAHPSPVDKAQEAALNAMHPGAVPGDVAEFATGFDADPLLAFASMACLFIDYGHTRSGLGDTLQAVRHHAYEHPLTSPGEADLTTQVDFERFGRTLRQHDRLRIDGPVTQAEFLGSLGMMERASRLMAANPAKAAAIEVAVARLMSPSGMGSRFKAIGVRSASLELLPGFASSPNSR
jgi:SAM-dependent MidA family methyltransferase